MPIGLTVPVQAQASFTTLHSFNAITDGSNPTARLTLSGKTMYGTTSGGLTDEFGTVFSINTNGTGFTTLYSFTAGSGGAGPDTALVLSGSTLYGTTVGDGVGVGSVFSVGTNGAGFTVLHMFNTTDGSFPMGDLVLSGDTLYGTAQGNTAGTNSGIVFSVKTDGTDFTILHAFSLTVGGVNSDGSAPLAGLTLSGSTLYGTASGGGKSGAGTVFSLKTDGTGFTTLYNFTGGADGADPQASLTLSGSTLYGTASEGGSTAERSSGNGTVFKIGTNGAGFTVLHTFSGATDGAIPRAALTLSDGTLYGTASSGGSQDYGTVFALNTNGTGFTTLYSFTQLTAGGVTSIASPPLSALVLSGATLYGTTEGGGADEDGAVYALTLNFSGQYEIQCEASGLAANVKGGSDTDGAEIIQWPFSGTGNEVWTFIPTSNGYYQINNIQSGRDIVVQGASTAGGAKIVQWSFGSSGDDQWKPVSNSDGSYTFYNLHSGLALDDPAGSTSQGTQFDQWAADQDTNQEFNLIPQ